MKQCLIAIDQMINTMTYLPGDGWGWADESFSARCWRMRRRYPRLRLMVDALFFWEPGHCRQSFDAEINRRQSPPEER